MGEKQRVGVRRRLWNRPAAAPAGSPPPSGVLKAQLCDVARILGDEALTPGPGCAVAGQQDPVRVTWPLWAPPDLAHGRLRAEQGRGREDPLGGMGGGACLGALGGMSQTRAGRGPRVGDGTQCSARVQGDSQLWCHSPGAPAVALHLGHPLPGPRPRPALVPSEATLPPPVRTEAPQSPPTSLQDPAQGASGREQKTECE